MESIVRALRSTFSSLAVPNYRRYSSGQAVSRIGTALQTTAQSWLVLTLTHSAVALGVVAALQTLPVLILGAYGGVIADRVDKRRLMIALQSLMGLQALILGLLTLTHLVQLWEIAALAVALGLNNAFENPTRQAFALEMVGARELRNAVTINSLLVNVGGAVGPAVAGILIASVGVGVCFILNAVSFVPVVASLLTLDRSRLRPSSPSGRGRAQLRQGLHYAASVPELAVPLLMMALVGTFAYEFQVVLPVLATHTFHGGAEAFGFMTASMGIGAVGGGLVTAARGRTGLRPLAIAAATFGVVIMMAAAAPTLTVEYLALGLVGWASISFIAGGNSTVQLASEPSMRGRMMALWAISFQGTAAVGGPLIGWVTAEAGPQLGLATGGISCLAAAMLGVFALRRVRRRGQRAAVGASEAHEIPVPD